MPQSSGVGCFINGECYGGSIAGVNTGVDTAEACNTACKSQSTCKVSKTQGCQMAKFDPFHSLDCAPTTSTLVQSKERKGSNFAIWQP